MIQLAAELNCPVFDILATKRCPCLCFSSRFERITWLMPFSTYRKNKYIFLLFFIFALKQNSKHYIVGSSIIPISSLKRQRKTLAGHKQLLHIGVKMFYTQKPNPHLLYRGGVMRRRRFYLFHVVVSIDEGGLG